MTTKINESLVSISPESLEANVKSYKQHRKGLVSFKMNLTVKPDKPLNKLKKDIFFDVETDESVILEDDSCYDNFLDYLRYAYEKYVSPLYVSVCKQGDVVEVSANVDEEGFFVDDTCGVTVVISIPNNRKGDWQAYVANHYKKLTKYYPFLTGLDFDTRDHKIQKVQFRFSFSMEEKQTVKFIDLNNDINEEAVDKWFATSMEVEDKFRRESHHTRSISAKIVQSEFGPVLEFGKEITRSKIE